MPAPISMDLRLRIVRAVDGGSSIREAARRCGVQAGLSTIHNALRRISLRHKKSP